MSSIVVSCGSYSNDDAECFATVTNESGFTEDFSTDDPQGTYKPTTSSAAICGDSAMPVCGIMKVSPARVCVWARTAIR